MEEFITSGFWTYAAFLTTLALFVVYHAVKLLVKFHREHSAKPKAYAKAVSAPLPIPSIQAPRLGKEMALVFARLEL